MVKRMKNTFFALLTMTFLSTMVGCSQDLLAVCEEAQAENCTNIENCSQSVDLGTALADKAGCTSQFDAYSDCATSTDDVCTIEATCSAQVNAFAECVLPYCNDHIEECTAFAEAFGI